jgi:xyloglucan-specific exo-beta-1,4-glucanase
VASDVGVYVTSDGGTTWRTLGSGLPNLPVDDIELVSSSNELFAGTFGRGMWKVSLTGL